MVCGGDMRRKNNRVAIDIKPALMRVVQLDQGKVAELGCPFCDPPVHIEPGKPCMNCGAQVEVWVSRPKNGKFIPYECEICHRTGGKMAKTETGYKHDPSCLILRQKILLPL